MICFFFLLNKKMSATKNAISISTHTLTYNSDNKLVRKEKVDISIAPKNAVIDFFKLLNDEFLLLDLADAQSTVPPSFDWRQVVQQKYPGKANNPKYQLSPVFDQKNCGCCWAIATIQAINDVHLCDTTGQGIQENPNIDVTTILTCISSNKNLKKSQLQNFNNCNGGNPKDLIDYISRYGVYNTPLNYNWCLQDRMCTIKCNDASISLADREKFCPEDQMAFLNDKFSKIQKSLKKGCGFNSAVTPKGVSGCGQGGIFIYNLKSPGLRPSEIKVDQNGELTEATKVKVKQLQYHMKQHIMKHGPIICGVPVISSLNSGDYLVEEKNNNGIFFDNYNYETNTYPDLPITTDENHAMSIIGWGVDDNVSNSMFSSDKDGNSVVEYWIIRNSWGAQWGIDGILHLAMYPFNKVCQVEVSSEKGSIVMFQSTCIPYQFRQKESSENFEDICQSVPKFFAKLTKCQISFIIILSIIIICFIFL